MSPKVPAVILFHRPESDSHLGSTGSRAKSSRTVRIIDPQHDPGLERKNPPDRNDRTRDPTIPGARLQKGVEPTRSTPRASSDTKSFEL